MNLVTERLVIRPWRLDEAPRKLDILSRVEIVRWLSDGEPQLMKDLAEAEAKIASHNAMPPPLGSWAIVLRDGARSSRPSGTDRETGIPAGSVMLNEVPNSAVGDEPALVQIGWSLHPDSHGNGYASEAAVAVLAYGHAAGITEIRALMNLDNYPSIAVARRSGMRHLGVTHDWYEEPSEVFISP